MLGRGATWQPKKKPHKIIKGNNSCANLSHMVFNLWGVFRQKFSFLYVNFRKIFVSKKCVCENKYMLIEDIIYLFFSCESLCNDLSSTMLFFLDVFPDNTCGLPVSTRHTNASQLFIFEYKGREIPEDCQAVGLHSSDASLNHYMLCITAVSFIDPNCSITVQFTFSDNAMVLLTFGVDI